MNGHLQKTTVPPLEKPVEDVVPRASLLRRLLGRRSARRLESAHQEHDQRLAQRVQEIIAGRGLIQADYSIGGGRCVHTPQVISVAAGPPVRLDIKILPGQTPDDFAAHASAIAYNLGVAEVRVVPLTPFVIRLELLP